MSFPYHPAAAALTALAQERILLLDGAMGTQIQNLKLSEEELPGPVPAMCTDITRTIRKKVTTIC